MDHHTSTVPEVDTASETSRPVPPPPEKETSSFWELVRFAIIAIIIVFPIRIFIAQPFIVAGSSMEPTFENGQYLIVDQISYRFDTPTRGDVVIFRYPRDPSKFFIKRVIGLPGDTVQITGTEVRISDAEHPNGFLLDESHTGLFTEGTHLTVTLADDEYFVLGDNRDASSDSRVWGALDRNMIIGRAFLRLLPVSTIDVLPGQ